MSNTNQVSAAYKKEASYGVAGASTENGNYIRLTGEGIECEQATVRSDEIKSSRGVSAIETTLVSAKGPLNGELPFFAHDDLFQWLFMSSDWSGTVRVTLTTISSASGDNSINDSANGFGVFTAGQQIRVTGFTGANAGNNGKWATISTVAAGKLVLTGVTLVTEAAGPTVSVEQRTFVTLTAATISAANSDNSFNDSGNGLAIFTVGQWMKATGFTGNNATNNGKPCKIVSVAAGKIVVSGITLIDDAAGESVTLKQANYIDDGTTATSFQIEKNFSDLTNEYHDVIGCMIAGANLDFTVGGMIKATFNILAKEINPVTSSVMGTPIAAPTTSPMNNVGHFQGMYLGGYAVANVSKARDIKLSIQNNLRERINLGDEGADSIGAGEFGVNATLQAYFAASSTIFSTFRAGTYTSLAIALKDADGNVYVVEIPSIKWSKCAVFAQAKNGDVMADCAFECREDPTGLYTLRLYRIPA